MTILKPFLLIVEGSSDKNFFESLCKFMTINDIEIIEVGGVSRFRDQVSAILRMDGFENVKTLGIIRDADNNVNQAFNSIQDVLRNNNLPVPTKMMEFTNTIPTVIVFIMPDCSNSGELEDICINSVSDTKEMCCTNMYFD